MRYDLYRGNYTTCTITTHSRFIILLTVNPDIRIYIWLLYDSLTTNIRHQLWQRFEWKLGFRIIDMYLIWISLDSGSFINTNLSYFLRQFAIQFSWALNRHSLSVEDQLAIHQGIYPAGRLRQKGRPSTPTVRWVALREKHASVRWSWQSTKVIDPSRAVFIYQVNVIDYTPPPIWWISDFLRDFYSAINPKR